MPIGMAIKAADKGIYLFGEDLGGVLGIAGYGNTALIVTYPVDGNAQFVENAGG